LLVNKHTLDGSSTVLIRFDTGEETLIPFDQLQLLSVSNDYLLSEANIEQWKTVEHGPVVPVIKEQIKIGRLVHQEEVQASRRVREEVEINEPGFREEIERIKGRSAGRPGISLYRGDLMVISIVEEVRVKKIRREGRERQS
jgi:hypothetical protein